MNVKKVFIEAVRANAELPVGVREQAEAAIAVEEHCFDETYIEFLDTQIELEPRGPEWAERLRRRRAALVPYCNVTLVWGRIRAGASDFTVEVDPESGAVVHWEEYEVGLYG